MEATKRVTTEQTIQDLGTALQEGEQALKAVTGEDGHDLRARLKAAIEKAKALYERLEDKTVAAAKATDKAVHEHPYQAIGIAFGVGLLVGILVTRNRRD